MLSFLNNKNIIDKTITRVNLYFLKYSIKKKNAKYIATSIQTLHIGPLNESPFSKPQEEIKNKFKIK